LGQPTLSTGVIRKRGNDAGSRNGKRVEGKQTGRVWGKKNQQTPHTKPRGRDLMLPLHLLIQGLHELSFPNRGDQIAYLREEGTSS